MEGFKEFQGKDLDAAIAEACSYFNAAREKLEIEIIQDAKSGIFGIVGARKAKVRARRAHLREAVESILGTGHCDCCERSHAAADTDRSSEDSMDSEDRAPREQNGRQPAPKAEAAAEQKRSQKPAQKAGQQGSQKAEQKAGRKSSEPDSPAAPAADVSTAEAGAEAPCCSQSSAGAPAVEEELQSGNAAAVATPAAPAEENSGRRADARENDRSRRNAGTGRSRREDRAVDAAAPETELGEELDEAGDGLPHTPVEELDAARLEALAIEAVRQLVRPIVGEAVQVSVQLGGGRVQISVESEEDSGLLIGREGQTLASLQYLVSRIISRGMNAAVRVQLDAGEYRRRQDEKLCEMAQSLAEKVRQTGRSYSTRPLSSYHRRIVHMCLQDVADVQTRSTGEGAMKRVVIMRRKGEKPQN